MSQIMQYDTELLIGIASLLFILLLRLYAQLNKSRKMLARSEKDVEKLAAKNAMLEAEQLKFQLQPHTLNNILANFHSLSNRLSRGMDSLSETLEYILYKGKSHYTSVDEEIRFVKSYVALNDLFVTEIDAIKTDFSGIDTESRFYADECIPHMITAYFIENAFKHGDKNQPEFVRIVVRLSNNIFEFKVVNKVNFKRHKPNPGLGLANMQKRLELLMPGKHTMTAQETESEYTATLILTLS